MQFVYFLCLFYCVSLGVTEDDIKSMKTWLESIDNKVSTIKDILTRKNQGTTDARIEEVATGKTAFQSTQHAHFDATIATDGKFDTFQHTKDEMNPYLVVDLGKSYHVKRVDIYNRRDCCGERLHDVGVYLGASHYTMSQCGYVKGKVATKAHLIFHCKPSRYARFVKVMINGYGVLHVAEVKVYALQPN